MPASFSRRIVDVFIAQVDVLKFLSVAKRIELG